MLVQNVGGAGGTVGSLQAAKAKPDGYTLLLHHIGMSTIPALYKKLAFDPLAAYEFIGVFAEAPMMILARRDFAPRTFAELVAYAKANGEKFTVASAGMGSVTHLCAMLFQEALGMPLTMVQYKGGGPAVIDVRSGQVDIICDLPTTNSGAIRSGDLKAYRADRAAAHGDACPTCRRRRRSACRASPSACGSASTRRAARPGPSSRR